jgi:hypothetical protein
MKDKYWKSTKGKNFSRRNCDLSILKTLSPLPEGALSPFLGEDPNVASEELQLLYNKPKILGNGLYANLGCH